MEYQDCLICKKKKATKTNSHLIPSFIVAKVCSYDGSGKRDKEVMFTMTSYEDKVYVGAVPDTKLDELFDQKILTDERIEKELKDNTASKDYIFCSICEANLSKYLETPYAEHLHTGKSLDANISYFFWVSVVWRMSISGQFKFTLPSDIEQSLGDCLHEYMDAFATGQNTTSIVEKCKLYYRLLRSPSYLPKGSAYLGGRYWEKNRVLTLTLGDTILCATFNNTSIPEDFLYLGLEGAIKSAPVNNGVSKENHLEVDNNFFEKAMIRMAKEMAFMRLCNEKTMADVIWRKVGLEGSMPDKIFVAFTQKLYSEDSKQGDRKTPERYVEIFNETMELFGYKARNKS